ncbi:unnamed protein product [Closterium sp. Yama58-4]|nr:unnamed protein product [Closterium sp. Yama58-4]
MAAEGVTSTSGLMKEAALAAMVEEVLDLQRTLAAVQGELVVIKEKLEAVRCELALVKEELAEQKGGRAEKFGEGSKPSDAEGLRGKSRKRRQGTTAESAWEEERRREVQELNEPLSMEESAACEEGQMLQDLKLDVELQIRESEGHRKMAWEQIKAASQWPLLDLSCTGLSDDILAHVSTMTHLIFLNLTSCSGLSAEGMKHLYRLPRLESLDLDGTDVSDSALEGIGSLTSLKALTLDHTKVTDAGLLHLTALTSLTMLRLSWCKGVTDAGMVHVGRLSALEALEMVETAITDAGLLQLTGLASLKMLDLSKCKGVTSAGLVDVGRLASLRRLHLWHDCHG